MKNISHCSKLYRKLAVILVGLFLVSIPPVWAQGKTSTKTLIGLSRVDPGSIQDSFTKDNIDQLNTTLFKRLDKNGDKAISAAEFKEWDTKIQTLSLAISSLFKSITGQQIFEATDVNGDAVITFNEMRALSYFDFISKDSDQNKLLDKSEIASQIPVILRLVSKDCKSINTMYNGVLMGGFCGGKQ